MEPEARAVRAVGVAGLGTGSLFGFALLPKCPLCIAAYLAAGPLVLYAWLVALALGVALLVRRLFARGSVQRLRTRRRAARWNAVPELEQ